MNCLEIITDPLDSAGIKPICDTILWQKALLRLLISNDHLENSMKNQIIRYLTIFVSFLFIMMGTISTASAAIKLTLIEGKKFIDYEVSNQSRVQSLRTVERDLNKLFDKVSSAYLAEKQIMEIDITNIDLPGMFHFGYGSQNHDIRIVDSNTSFKLYFSYRIKDSEGNIIREGEHKIKEFSDSGIASRHQNRGGTVGYYRRPLEKWFKVIFTQ